MASSASKTKGPASLGAGLLVFCWPLVYYYRLLIPDQGFSLRLGNDFRMLYYAYKAYLLDRLAQGAFPLWSPSEAAGFPFYSNPFTQAFYPLNLPLAGFYRLMGGYSYFDHQAYTVLGLSFFALGLFLWLGRLLGNRRAVVLAVLVVSLDFKLGEILRLSNAVHAAAWLPWLLWGVTLAAQGVRPFKAAGAVFVPCLLLLTAGYPYYVYYALFLVPPYALALLWPPARRALGLGERPPATLRYLLTLAGGALAALALAGPYLYQMARLMGQTVDRAGAGLAFATSQSLTPLDTLGSLLYPPAAQSEGWFYLGTAALLLLVLHGSASLGRGGPGRDRWLWLGVLPWFCFIVLITYGKHTPLFGLLYHWLPGFDRLRLWGRLNIILLPVLALLLARAYAWLEDLLFHPGPESPARRRRALITLALGAGLMLAAQLWLHLAGVRHLYWTRYFQAHQGQEALFIWAGITSALALAGMLALAGREGRSGPWNPLLVLLVLVALSLADLRPVGAEQWTDPAPPGLGRRLEIKTGRNLALSLTTRRVNRYDTISLTPVFNVGYIKNWYFERYVRFHRRVFQKEAPTRPRRPELVPWFRRLMGLEQGRRIFFTRSLDHPSLVQVVQDDQATRKDLAPVWRVTYYDGDRLELVVESREGLFLSFIDNWDPDWRAFIDDQPAPLLKLLGTFKSLRLEAGRHRVRMEYRPWG